jgi:heme oxygenase
MEPTVGPALAERLRLETRALHAEAERTGVMAELLHGRLGRAAYCALLRNLHAIYAALEAALGAHRGDAMIGAVQSPALLREAALAQDLETLHGPAWRDDIDVAPAATEYVLRLQALAAEASPQLVAHAYVRYLGDLHGGQLLKRRIAAQLGLGDAGTHFYEFGDASQVQALIARFRGALGAMQPAAGVVDFIVAEACWAFGQHKRLFEQLQAARC